MLLLLLACDGSDPAKDSPATNDTGTPPAWDWSDDQTQLLDGVTTIESGGAYPSGMVLWGDKAFPVVADDASSLTWVAAAYADQGRVVAFGHESHLSDPVSKGGDSDRLVLNALRWAGQSETPTIGLHDGVSGLQSWLTDEGLTAADVGLDQLDTIDVLVTDTYGDWSESEIDSVREFVRDGGGLLTGGHAWWWVYEGNENPAENHLHSQLLWDAGITVGGESPGDVGTDPVSPLGELYHATRALSAIEDHLSDSAPMATDDQVLAATTVGLAVSELPIHFDFFQRAIQIQEGAAPVIPSSTNPISPSTQPIESIIVRIDSKLAQELPANEIVAHPAAADFPGLVGDVQRTYTAFAIDGTQEARDDRYWYSGATADVWRSTGIYAPPGEVLTITVTAPGQGLVAAIGSHTDTLWSNSEWTRSPELVRTEELAGGPNTQIASAFGGLLYIRVPQGSTLGTVNVEVDGGVSVPVFEEGDTWTGAPTHVPFMELKTEGLVLTVPTSAVTDDPTDILAFWRQVQAANAALSSEDRVRDERIVVDRQISAGWMHSGYPIMGGEDTAPYLIDGDTIFGEGTWGPLHELGHNHQLGDWLLPGTTETTCNLFSVLGSEQILGIDRGTAHSALSESSRADRIEDYVNGGADFWSDWSVWTALETYLQLQEAFGWELYEVVFSEYTALSASESPADDQARIDEWVLRSSYAAGVDLGPFYTAWGFPTSTSVLDEVAALPTWSEDPMNE